MTRVIIESNSEEKTKLLVEFAQDLGLDVHIDNFQELDAKAMARGIGRKATEKELITYLSKGLDKKPVKLVDAMSRYSPNNR